MEILELSKSDIWAVCTLRKTLLPLGRAADFLKKEVARGGDLLSASQTLVCSSAAAALPRGKFRDVHSQVTPSSWVRAPGAGLSDTLARAPGDSGAHSALRASGSVTVFQTELVFHSLHVQPLANFLTLLCLKLFIWKNSSLQGYREDQMFTQGVCLKRASHFQLLISNYHEQLLMIPLIHQY